MSGTENACAASVPRRIWLLSAREYENVIQQLFGHVPPAASQVLLRRPNVNGFDNQSEYQSVNGSSFEAFWEASTAVVAQLDSSTLLSCEWEATAEVTRACVADFIADFGRRAYGRPVNESELGRLLRIFDVGVSEVNTESAIRAVVLGILNSPGFLYRTELGGTQVAPVAGEEVELTAFELASALSFFLTGSRPDGTLLESAGAGSLRKPWRLEWQARRLLQTRAGRTHLRSILSGWFGLHHLQNTVKVGDYAEIFTDELRAAMHEEAVGFIDNVLWQGSGRLSELLTRSKWVVPPALQELYNTDLLATPVSGRPVALRPERRGGILSLPAFLSVHSAAEHSNPVRRGLFVRQQLLCTRLPNPPAGVVNSIPEGMDSSKTTRQKFERHTSDDACRGCHTLIDPIGFGFEQMDAIGRYRTTESGVSIDSTGELLGADVAGRFEGPAELGEMLAGSEMAHACMRQQFYSFAMGKSLEATDDCALRSLRESLEHDAPMQDLMLAIVKSRQFWRRATGHNSQAEDAL